MQIVIDIPESIYEYYKNKYPKNCARLTFVENALLEGTPLPKGHGRLIDADKLEFEKCTLETDSSISFYMIDKEDVDNAPTIIEADKEQNNA